MDGRFISLSFAEYEEENNTCRARHGVSVEKNTSNNKSKHRHHMFRTQAIIFVIRAFRVFADIICCSANQKQLSAMLVINYIIEHVTGWTTCKGILANQQKFKSSNSREKCTLYFQPSNPWFHFTLRTFLLLLFSPWSILTMSLFFKIQFLTLVKNFLQDWKEKLLL